MKHLFLKTVFEHAQHFPIVGPKYPMLIKYGIDKKRTAGGPFARILSKNTLISDVRIFCLADSVSNHWQFT